MVSFRESACGYKAEYEDGKLRAPPKPLAANQVRINWFYEFHVDPDWLYPDPQNFMNPGAGEWNQIKKNLVAKADMLVQRVVMMLIFKFKLLQGFRVFDFCKDVKPRFPF